MSRINHKSTYQSIALALAVIAYTAVTFLVPMPPETNTYHLSTTTIQLIQLSLIIPIAAIWYIAFYGGVRFYRYAYSIGQSSDGAALSNLADGLMILVLALVSSSLISSLRQVMIQVGAAQGWTIFANYVTIFLTLLAFVRMYQGASVLATKVAKVDLQPQKWLSIGIVAVMAALYVTAIFHDATRNMTPDPRKLTSFYLPDSLILSTIVLPYLLTWYFGLMTALSLQTYQKNVKGSVYRQALTGLYRGILAVVIFSMALQLLVGIGPLLSQLNLSGILAFIYVIILLYAVGYILIARGARRLSKIEEVTG